MIQRNQERKRLRGTRLQGGYENIAHGAVGIPHAQTHGDGLLLAIGKIPHRHIDPHRFVDRHQPLGRSQRRDAKIVRRAFTAHHHKMHPNIPVMFL